MKFDLGKTFDGLHVALPDQMPRQYQKQTQLRCLQPLRLQFRDVRDLTQMVVFQAALLAQLAIFA